MIQRRRRPHNSLGFALQLCTLRYPDRLPRPGNFIPGEISKFLAVQLDYIAIPGTLPPSTRYWIKSSGYNGNRVNPAKRLASVDFPPPVFLNTASFFILRALLKCPKPAVEPLAAKQPDLLQTLR